MLWQPARRATYTHIHSGRSHSASIFFEWKTKWETQLRGTKHVHMGASTYSTQNNWMRARVPMCVCMTVYACLFCFFQINFYLFIYFFSLFSLSKPHEKRIEVKTNSFACNDYLFCSDIWAEHCFGLLLGLFSCRFPIGPCGPRQGSVFISYFIIETIYT